MVSVEPQKFQIPLRAEEGQKKFPNALLEHLFVAPAAHGDLSGVRAEHKLVQIAQNTVRSLKIEIIHARLHHLQSSKSHLHFLVFNTHYPSTMIAFYLPAVAFMI